MDLASIVRGKADFLIGMRRRIHAHPELSGREFERIPRRTDRPHFRPLHGGHRQV